ncbi:MAG TPA: hypothetical protein VMB85_23410 [Bryobacteraceae bacterium]|nr:hypothetical protein [Bryobacteraceae bacterium]
MKFTKVMLSVSALALMMIPAKAANGPAYNPATAVAASGTVTAVRVVPVGQPLAGVHVMLKTKANTVDVYLAPKDFMNFLKTNFAAGDEIDVTGSRVKSGTADVILAREVSDGVDVIELRDLYGAPAWENWGVEADPAAIH